MRAYLVGAILFAAAIAAFIFQNTATVTIKFLNWASPDISLALIVILAACAGALITFLLDSFRHFKVAKKSNELIKQNTKLAKELQQLKEESRATRTAPEKTRPTKEV